MPDINSVRDRAALTQFMSVAALEPRRRPLKTLWIGDMSSSLEGMAAMTEPTISAEIGSPIRLTMFRLLKYIETSFPRHVPWTMFPVVSEPFYEFKAVQERHAGFSRDDIYPDPGQGLVEVSDIFDRFEAYVIDVSHGTPLEINEELLRLTYAVSCLADQNKPVYVKAMGWKPYTIGTYKIGAKTHSEVKREDSFTHLKTLDVLDRLKPYAMMMYSYRINFQAVAMKAIRAARFDADTPSIIDHLDGAAKAFQRNHDASYGKRRSSFDDDDDHQTFEVPKHRFDSNHYWRIFRGVKENWESLDNGLTPQGLDHPFALQLLYALRRKGPVSCELFLNSWDGSHRLFSGVLGDYEETRSRYWLGTGKYPKLEFPMNDEIELSLLSSGLVEIDHKSKLLSVTKVGEKFLDFLHPTNEDPDVILRWVDEHEMFFRKGSDEAISEWLTKFFRKMKTKVNAIPEHLTEHRGRSKPRRLPRHRALD